MALSKHDCVCGSSLTCQLLAQWCEFEIALPFPPKKIGRWREYLVKSVFGNFTWKFFFSCLVLCPGDFLCPQATCFLCHIHIIHSHCLLLCSQLLEGSFTSQVSHEVDGLIFQPIGVSLIQIQTGK